MSRERSGTQRAPSWTQYLTPQHMVELITDETFYEHAINVCIWSIIPSEVHGKLSTRSKVVAVFLQIFSL